MTTGTLGWLGIVRLGLVQTALGAIVVLTTSTMNRIMVVELALPAMLPGVLVGVHHAVQLLRPRFGYGSDVGGRRTPWIIGGMAVLAIGAVIAASATAWMSHDVIQGTALAVVGFLLIGLGVGSAGTSLLVLLAKQVNPQRRAPAATIVWVMMIAGFVVTAGTAGHFLDPYSPQRLIVVTACVSMAAFVLAICAVYGVEKVGLNNSASEHGDTDIDRRLFREALREVWIEPAARRFTIFVFVSMLAYSMQDLILEPFAGLLFHLTPGETTKLSGLQNGGVLSGMILVAILGRRHASRFGTLQFWTVAGCIGSAIALSALTIASFAAPAWPIKLTVFLLGFTNGAFAVAAIGSMMALAGAGRERREGVRMGLWGASQAIAFGVGGFVGTVLCDAIRWLVSTPVIAYATVFAIEAGMFLVAAALASRITEVNRTRLSHSTARSTPKYVPELSGR